MQEKTSGHLLPNIDIIQQCNPTVLQQVPRWKKNGRPEPCLISHDAVYCLVSQYTRAGRELFTSTLKYNKEILKTYVET